jgi:deoxyribonuclease-1-like protein
MFRKPFILTIFLFLQVCVFAQVSICSWNIQNFGKSKSDIEIEYIANTIKKYDAVAIIEVVAGYGGSQAVAKLSDILNRKGTKWDYVVSDPTSSLTHGTERYALLWKTSKLTKIGDAWLEKKYSNEIEREPFFVSLKSGGKIFTLAIFHAVPTNKHPDREIRLLQYLPAEYPNKNIVFCGDYNCPQSNAAFQPLKSQGYKPIFTNQKTSLKNTCIEDDCLASEYDNIFYNPNRTKFIHSGIIHFYTDFTTIKEAKNISDHIPVFFQFSLN